jgi:putative ABC transport system ATP-binding protein
MSLLVDVQARLNKTIVVITHNQALGQIADRVVRLRSGEIAELHANATRVSPEEVTW